MIDFSVDKGSSEGRTKQINFDLCYPHSGRSEIILVCSIRSADGVNLF
ncbi:hypothetical protein [Streptococcus anginosus]|nr:hypothetical protein [Streptococcus anginosus]